MQNYSERDTLFMSYSIQELEEKGINIKELALTGNAEEIQNLCKKFLEEYDTPNGSSWKLEKVEFIKGNLSFWGVSEK